VLALSILKSVHLQVVRGRMNKLASGIVVVAALIGTPAFAADMAVKAPPPQAVPSPAFDWSGFYFGMSAGYAFGGSSTSTFSGDPNIGQTLISGRPPLIGTAVPQALSTNTKGFMAGVQIGYNYRLGIGVVGLEADFSGADAKGSASAIGSPTDVFGDVFGPFQTTLEKQIDWFGTVRGRVGILASERLLVYATGGLAFGGTRANLAIGSVGNGVAFFSAPSRLNCGNPCLAGNSSGTSTGGVVGGGFEYALSDRITFKSEYLFVNLGHRTVTATGTQAPTTPDVFVATRVNFEEQIVRAGLNVHLN
jgi:outer membrane immunogenic protein